MKNEMTNLKNDNLGLLDFLIFFDKLEDYRNRTISGIVFIYKNENITIKDFDIITRKAHLLKDFFYQSILFKSASPVFEKSNTNIFITFHEGENITFLKISELNPYNEE